MYVPTTGQAVEYFGDAMVIVSVDADRKTFTLNYDESTCGPLMAFRDRPWSELNNLGNKVIWNHE